MGTNIRELVGEIKEEIPLDALSNKKIAIDAYNTLYQFLSVIRQPDGTPLMDSKGNITSHLSGLFYRTITLLEKGLDLIYVFDGTPPEMKHLTLKKRIERREEAMEKWKEMIEKEEIEEARKYAQASSTLTKDMVEEAKELLNAMGIKWVQAPGEGEAQAAYIVKKGDAYAAASQDYDSLIFGSPLLVRNISITGRRKIPGTNQYKEVMPEKIELEKLLSYHNITREQLICIAILVGTDYNEGGVKGIGAKKALELVKKYKTPENVYKVIKDKWEHEVSFEDIFEFFNNPEVDENYNIVSEKFDENKILSFLVDKHDFDENRVKSALERLKKLRERGKQKTLF